MKVRGITVGLSLLLLAAGVTVFVLWRRGEPRRSSIHTLERLQTSLGTGNPTVLLDTLLLPPALAQRTAPEQAEFINKTLRDEISPEGIVALKKGGRFGPLQEVFPAEGDRWAQQAGVKVEDCLAFRMERNSIQAEVVVHRSGTTYRIVRCNNVKQMAS